MLKKYDIFGLVLLKEVAEVSLYQPMLSRASCWGLQGARTNSEWLPFLHKGRGQAGGRCIEFTVSCVDVLRFACRATDTHRLHRSGFFVNRRGIVAKFHGFVMFSAPKSMHF